MDARLNHRPYIAGEANSTSPCISSGLDASRVTELLNELERIKEQLRVVTRERKRYLKYLTNCLTPTALSKLMDMRADKRFKPKDNGKLRPICFPQEEGTLLSIKPIGTFDKAIDKDALFKAARPIKVQSTSAVYFLLNSDDDVVYVGQAKNLLARIGTHCYEKNGLFSKVAAISVPLHRLDAVERMYIQAYSPILNKTGKTSRNDDGAELNRVRRIRAIKQINKTYSVAPDLVNF